MCVPNGNQQIWVLYKYLSLACKRSKRIINYVLYSAKFIFPKYILGFGFLWAISNLKNEYKVLSKLRFIRLFWIDLVEWYKHYI